MSQFTGKQYKGAKRDRRIEKRDQAEARNKQTTPERRSTKPKK